CKVHISIPARRASEVFSSLLARRAGVKPMPARRASEGFCQNLACASGWYDEVHVMLTDQDLYLFNEGNHFQLYDKLGAHPVIEKGTIVGTSFAVWAPNAREVSVIGDFNNWDKGRNSLFSRGQSGIWQAVIEGVTPGTVYKYHVVSHHNGYTADKADPLGFFHEMPPRTGSV